MTFNKKILHTLVVLAVMFLGLAVYLTYFQIVKAPSLAASGQNPRTLIKEQEIKRGNVYDRNGTVLAKSENTGEGYERVYPYNDLYSHVIGYSHHKYGRSALESEFNKYLAGGEFVSSVFNVWDRLMGSEEEGANLVLTVDHDLQSLADSLIGNRSGSVVAISPQTGEVLAMVSKPGFNPNPAELAKNWDTLSLDENSALLPRAIMGLYPPGSSFKPIVAVAALEEEPDTEKFNDEGSIIIDGKEFKNNKEKEYGEITIDDAMAYSVNTMFVSLADSLGAGKLKNVAQRFYIGEQIPFDLQVSKGNILSVSNPDKTEIASVGIGQGDLLTTPMHMALAAAALANDGVMMKPFIVDRAELDNGFPVYRAKKTQLGRVASPDVSRRVIEMMEKCVEEGTGKNAKISGVTIAGKTGTAENERGINHAWFIACAPLENPEIAVAVMLEYDGTSGSEACVPIAREIIKSYLDK